MTWGWVNYQQKFFLKVNYSFKCSTEPFRPPAIHLFLSDIIVSLSDEFVLYLIVCRAFVLDLYFSFLRWHGLAGSITSPSSLRCWTQWVMFPIYYFDFMKSALLLKQTAYRTANLWHTVSSTNTGTLGKKMCKGGYKK